MYNGDYIPLDQAVIDQEVEQLEKNRKIKIGVLRDAYKNAGGNYDIVVFRNRHVFRRLTNALDELKIFWCEHDGEILASRHEVEDYIRD